MASVMLIWRYIYYTMSKGFKKMGSCFFCLQPCTSAMYIFCQIHAYILPHQGLPCSSITDPRACCCYPFIIVNKVHSSASKARFLRSSGHFLTATLLICLCSASLTSAWIFDKVPRSFPSKLSINTPLEEWEKPTSQRPPEEMLMELLLLKALAGFCLSQQGRMNDWFGRTSIFTMFFSPTCCLNAL